MTKRDVNPPRNFTQKEKTGSAVRVVIEMLKEYIQILIEKRQKLPMSSTGKCYTWKRYGNIINKAEQFLSILATYVNSWNADKIAM